ncbi:hypothetical protein B0T21DRAFT_190188 [Apiosordaria backusii]|uniref:Uncharacterized protein n=1 Tax=Apiosordaria backusii TaxID=314023 RepID=A0AA40BK10_9PEZI|nr:hypothetical protein B0T21DRAFT_190188 [Apiosordaria backusii]
MVAQPRMRLLAEPSEPARPMAIPNRLLHSTNPKAIVNNSRFVAIPCHGNVHLGNGFTPRMGDFSFLVVKSLLLPGERILLLLDNFNRSRGVGIGFGPEVGTRGCCCEVDGDIQPGKVLEYVVVIPRVGRWILLLAGCSLLLDDRLLLVEPTGGGGRLGVFLLDLGFLLLDFVFDDDGVLLILVLDNRLLLISVIRAVIRSKIIHPERFLNLVVGVVVIVEIQVFIFDLVVKAEL